MKIKIFSIFFILFFHLHASPQLKDDWFTVLFYNLENLFDTVDDPDTEDDDFTPGGSRHWNISRLNRKLLNISKVLINVKGWSLPAIYAFCEVENRDVLEKMLYITPLRDMYYRIIHKESPDHRGMDVALLYDPSRFYPLNYHSFPIFNRKKEIIKTREILYVSGMTNGSDTLHIFVNHWPSRYGGILETQEGRILAAATLRKKIDEVIMNSGNPKIIVLGDFNDNPGNKSIKDVLRAKRLSGNVEAGMLYNLSERWHAFFPGSLKYHYRWDTFDQIMVSSGLLKKGKGWKLDAGNSGIVKLPYLLERDEKYGGIKPRRTWNGYRYQEGFSDHLPVWLDLHYEH